MFRTRLALLGAVIPLLIAACGSATGDESTATIASVATTGIAPPTAADTNQDFPVTIAAANGEIEIPALPTNIVSMSATHTEMLFAIGAGDQVVAVDAFSNYPVGVPITDLTGFAPNVEAIIGYGTDLVVTDGDWDGTSMGALSDLGVPVLILPAALSLDDAYTQLEQLGAATDHVAEAADLVVQMRADIAGILASLPTPDKPVTIYHELDSSYYSVTSETFIGHIYNLMGFINIADAVGEDAYGYPQLSEEYILEQDPDLILLADTICCDITGDSLGQRPGWDTLTAVKRGAVVELNDDVASRWGPRIVEHMEAVAEATSALLVTS